MPAIRYRFNARSVIVNHLPGEHFVDVLLRSGEYTRVAWLGFVCEAGIPRLGSLGYSKMLANEISPDEGLVGAQWRTLKDEHVVCVRVAYTKGSSGVGVYGLVDQAGWPKTVA